MQVPVVAVVPEGGIWGWLTVLGQFINYFLSYGLLRVLTVSVDPFRAYYNISLTQFNTLAAGCSLGFSVGGLFGGSVVEKLGARRATLSFGIIPGNRFVDFKALNSCR